MFQQDKKDTKDKKNKIVNGSQKVWIIWGVIIFALISIYAFDRSNPTQKTDQWNINRVIEAARNKQIVRGTVVPLPSAGYEYYRVVGIAQIGTNPKPNDYSTGFDQTSMEPIEVHFQAEGRLTEKRYNELMNFAELEERPSSTFLKDLLLGLLPFLLIIFLLYFLFTRQMKMAGRGAMGFGKSKAKLLTRDREKILFKQVAGCDEAKEEVSEIVSFLKEPKKFQKIGGRIPKGCLMVGPPGTGKTLLAKAIAGEADVPFFSISGSDFVEMFVGVGAARVRDMFEQGRKSAPCLLFIDEIDAVGRQRGAGLGGGNDEREQTLNSLLVEMDGFEAQEGVIVIAATNRPDVLDKALLRPGRFDRQITIDLPDLNGRHEILKVHAEKVSLDEDLDLAKVARTTPGFSGADLANLLNEGALLAARYDAEKVNMSHLNEARDKISYGRERKRLMDDKDKQITAYHEAGHAIVAAVLEDSLMDVHKVTIIPRGRSLGSTMFSPKKDILNYPLSHLRNQIALAMGGRVAEEITFSEITSGASGDIKMATDLARKMVCDWGMSELGPVAFGDTEDQVFLGKEISRANNFSEETSQRVDAEISNIISNGYKEAQRIFGEKKEALETLSLALIEHETVEGIHVLEILEHGSIQSEVKKLVPKTAKKKLDDEHKKTEESNDDPITGDTLDPASDPAPA